MLMNVGRVFVQMFIHFLFSVFFLRLTDSFSFWCFLKQEKHLWFFSSPMAESVIHGATPEVAAPVASAVESSTPNEPSAASPCPDRAAEALTPEPAPPSSSSEPTPAVAPAAPRRPVALGDRLQCVWAEDGQLRLCLISSLF